MKTNLIKYTFLLILFFSCKNNTDIIITDEIINLSESTSSVIDEFYLDNLRLPKSISEAKQYYSNMTDVSWLSKIGKNEKIKYILLNSSSSEKADEYYLIYTDHSNEDVDKDYKKIIKNLVTFCEYEKGEEGDILLNYNSTYNIIKNRVNFNFEKSQSLYWKEKISYNISFNVNPSNITFKENKLDFTAKIDSTIIEGSFFSNKSKRHIINKIKKGDTLDLQGFKISNNSKSLKLIGVTINNSLRNTLPGRYYDEDGKTKVLPYMRGCE